MRASRKRNARGTVILQERQGGERRRVLPARGQEGSEACVAAMLWFLCRKQARMESEGSSSTVPRPIRTRHQQKIGKDRGRDTLMVKSRARVFKTPKGVLVCDHAGRVINKLSLVLAAPHPTRRRRRNGAPPRPRMSQLTYKTKYKVQVPSLHLDQVRRSLVHTPSFLDTWPS